MSAGIPCSCPPDVRPWVVTARECNYSAFNGYKRTPSAYSEVKCLKCGGKWRTKADYVSVLPDMPEKPRGFRP